MKRSGVSSQRSGLKTQDSIATTGDLDAKKVIRGRRRRFPSAGSGSATIPSPGTMGRSCQPSRRLGISASLRSAVRFQASERRVQSRQFGDANGLGLAMAARFYPPLAARPSPQPRRELLLPLLAHAQQLRQGVTMYLSSSKTPEFLRRATHAWLNLGFRGSIRPYATAIR